MLERVSCMLLPIYPEAAALHIEGELHAAAGCW